MKRLTLDKLHGNEGRRDRRRPFVACRIPDFTDLIDMTDVWVVNRRGDASFTHESGANVFPSHRVWLNEFQGHVPPEGRVFRSKHGAHSALAQEAQNAI